MYPLPISGSYNSLARILFPSKGYPDSLVEPFETTGGPNGSPRRYNLVHLIVGRSREYLRIHPPTQVRRQAETSYGLYSRAGGHPVDPLREYHAYVPQVM